MTENAIDPRAKAREATIRREYIEGLRKLAVLLEKHEQLPTPYDGNRAVGDSLHIFHGGPPAVELMLAVFGRPASVRLRDVSAWMTWHLDGVAVQLNVSIDEVSSQIVTGSYRIADEVHEHVEHVLFERFQPETDGAA